MAENIQTYYEKLIAQQSESIRKYLVKYGLTEWDNLAPTLTNKEREYILNGYSKGILLRAVSFFRKIVTNAQLKETVRSNKEASEAAPQTIIDKDKEDNKEHDCFFKNSPQSNYVDSNTITNNQESKRNFEILFNDLSIRAQNILLFNNINCIDNLAPWIEGKNKDFLMYRNCGRRTSEELMEMVSLLREDLGLSRQTSVERSNESQDGESRRQYEEINSGDGSSDNVFGKTFVSIGNHIQIQKRFEQLVETLSVRARNVLFANRVVNVEDFLALTSKRFQEIMKYPNCGKKTALELLEAKNILQPPIIEIETTDKKLFSPFEIIIHFKNEEQEKLSSFKKKHGHWPMIFILYSKIKLLLKPRELAAFEDRYGIRKHDELEGLSKQGVLSLFERAVKKIQENSSFRQLCEYKDWDLYHVNNIPFPVFNNRKSCIWEDIEQMITKENLFFDTNFYELALSEGRSKEQSEVFLPINLPTFKVFLRFWGHLPLWWNKNSLVPYCPREKNGCCDPSSPIVIDKRFAAFKFTSAVKEIERLQKIKTVNDITISIERYFVDNEAFWHKHVDLTNEDKSSLLCFLKKLFEKNCSACVVEDNLLFKANQDRNDFGTILYEILSIEGARLHRDELLKRLNIICDAKGLRCEFSNSSQMLHYLVKDSRITPFGKSGYWGLKEWGENTGSIREISIQIVKKNKEPIRISNLIKKILDRRPDSKKNSISTVIFQAVGNGELVLFFDDYIGYPKRKYDRKYILMPKTFADWLHEFKKFVKKNRRFPFSNQKGYEGCLYRWFFKARQLTELSPEEVLKFDSVMKELSKYPQDATEFNFLQRCNIIKNFIEANKRMLTEEDDLKLFNWFYSTSKKYKSFHDNRRVYFSVLLEQISDILY